MKEFDRMVEIMKQLRTECPWDKEQTLESLRPYLIEEAFECLDALNDYTSHPESIDHFIEELGDLLLQVLFHAEILSETHKSVTIATVLHQLAEKLIRRHPHIYKTPGSLQSASEVLNRWEEIKKSENPNKRKSQLDGLSKEFPPLLQAHKLGERAAKDGFDWPTTQAVREQVQRELEELDQAKTHKDKEEELGDLLFSLAQWGRHQGINSEIALARANAKFISRYKQMEKKAAEAGREFKSLSLDDKESLWIKAKEIERSKDN